MATTVSILLPTKAPNLPIAPVDYTQRYQDQLLNVLRLYFNTIDNFTQQFVSEFGGGNIKFPHIAASDSTDQYATANDTPTLVKWNSADSILGFTLNPSGTATCNVAGVYKITYSAQLANNINAVQDAVFWLKVNGVDVDKSSTIFTLPARKNATTPSFVCGYSEVTFQVAVDDEIALYWATDQAASSGGTTGVYIHADPAQTTPYVRPAIPSMIGSITFVSAIY